MRPAPLDHRGELLIRSLNATGSGSPRRCCSSSTQTPGALLFSLGSAGSCGDVLGHFGTPDGTIADPDLESGTVGLGVHDLCGAGQAIAVASGF
ncbi:MAG: hypothetical protein ACR2LI_02445 [Propionibacteriaceae bacterium]